MNYALKFQDLELDLEVTNKQIIAKGYTLEDEKIAAVVSNFYSKELIFLMGLEFFLEEYGLENTCLMIEDCVKRIEDNNPNALYGNNAVSLGGPYDEIFLLLSNALGVPDGILEYQDEELLDILSRSNFEEVRRNVAGSSFNTPKIRERLANDPKLAVRREISLHRDTSQEILVRLAQEGDLRVAVLNNDNAPHSLHKKYLNDKDILVRKTIALFSNNQEILQTLSTDTIASVREDVARNSKTSRKILESLRHDEFKEVSAAAEIRLAYLEGEVSLI